MPEVTRPQMPQSQQAYLYPSAKPSSRHDTDALFLFLCWATQKKKEKKTADAFRTRTKKGVRKRDYHL
jgi:hypothetical protein